MFILRIGVEKILIKSCKKATGYLTASSPPKPLSEGFAKFMRERTQTDKAKLIVEGVVDSWGGYLPSRCVCGAEVRRVLVRRGDTVFSSKVGIGRKEPKSEDWEKEVYFRSPRSVGGRGDLFKDLAQLEERGVLQKFERFWLGVVSQYLAQK
ncbi:hypothetical protein BGX38DRAFT_1269226 [Terfezia claveryi]|nr:hypothetical protein BGX38DRAFT_1269226 [Terfezia claveryi]